MLVSNMGGQLATTNVAVPTTTPTESRQPTNSELIEKASIKHGVNAAVAIRIAKCESSLRQFNPQGEVLRGVVNSLDVGIFQLNEYYHLAESKSRGYDIYTTEGNIEYAMHLLETQGTEPWNWSKPCWGEKV